jgi:hypothetical protein
LLAWTKIRSNMLNRLFVFQNKSLHPQRPVWLQLAVTLERMGCHGNGASVGRFAREWGGIGNGTVTLYSKRIVIAPVDLRKEYIKWPNRQ